MKKKILSIALIAALLMSMLVTLTACGGDSSKKDSEASSAKDVIKEYEKNLNKGKTSTLAKQFDVKKFNKLVDGDYETEDIEEAYEYFLEMYEDEEDWYEIQDTTKIKDIDDLEDADVYYDEDILEECIDKYEVYLLDIEVDGEEEQDFVVINDGKIVYNMIISFCIDMDYDDDYDYDYDYDDDDYDYESTEPNDSDFNAQFDGYEGDNISGTKVKELLDTAIESNEEGSDLVWIYFYGEDDDYSGLNYTEDEINDIKDKIESTHKYTVEYEYDYSGYVDDITIRY